MYFTLMHYISHYTDENMDSPLYNHKRRNAITFIIGSVAYWLTYAFLPLPDVAAPFPIALIRDLFFFILVADVLNIALKFKKYWGHSITKEFSLAPPVDKIAQTL